MADTEIESIGPDDWEVFRDIRLRALADAPEAFGSTYADWVEAPESRWRDRLEVVELNVVARRGSELVGMASGSAWGDDAGLISMWVDPAARGAGVAEQLIAQVLAWGGERSTYLHVRSDNPRALGAYLKTGFVDLGLRPDQERGDPPEKLMVHQQR